MRAVVMKEFGGPEVLRVEEVADLEPRPGHHLLRVTRAGINYADVHARTDSYLAPVTLPHTPGNEVLGTTPDGRRYIGLTRGGGYAEHAHVHRRTAWEVPDDITDDQAIPLALQGQTAWHLLHTTAQLRPHHSILIPAAGGGVGSLAVQLAKHTGARVIALASTETKRRLARELGADTVLDPTTDHLAEQILDTAGGPVDIALEMTAGPLLNETLNALAPRGTLVLYGYASGTPTDLPARTLMTKGINVAPFWLPHLYSDRDALPTSITALYKAVRDGTLTPLTGGTYPLTQAPEAHHTLTSRTHLGKLSLDPTR
ncbi:zinc-binding dehydrogenase [Streptomyces sp. 3MP-14]|uniref:Zinc-binding dehydrogenase n=1 Tax=Streptomyces mimosae TaxID=2586635 RepID=A0A5N6ACD3_9ACTN|nr:MULTISPECIES: zinc-binding dehydrogenase [Streptomyces]KAB8165703.1 zinc-binding dehydrogenase [Streptomyces mimosae]KAB8176092.1 zinc-binding dehydrogenase [Streptomyces sp. 3MP-14]